MARRYRKGYRPYSKATKRDKYGRFQGRGGLKPWKSNFPKPGGTPRYYAPGGKSYTTVPPKRTKAMKVGGASTKKSNTARNLAIGAVAVGAVGATAYGIHKYRKNGGRFPGENPKISNRARVRHGQMKAKGLTKIMGMSMGTSAIKAAVTAVTDPKPRQVTPQGKRARSNGVVAPKANPQVAPATVKTPRAVDAGSLVRPKASAAQASAVAVQGDSKNVGAKPGTPEYWKRVDAAKKAGIPAAAIYIEDGGKLPGEPGYKPPAGKGSVLAPVTPTVSTDAKPKKPKAAQAAAVKKAVSFREDPGIIAVAQDPELRLVNPNGRPVKSFLSINSKQRSPAGQPAPTWKRKDGTTVPNTVEGVKAVQKTTVKSAAAKKPQRSPATEGTKVKPGKSISSGNSKVPTPAVKPNPTANPRPIKGAKPMPRSLADYNEAWVDPDADVTYKNVNKLVPGKESNGSPDVLTLEQQRALYKNLGKKKGEHKKFEERMSQASSVHEALGLLGPGGVVTKVKGTDKGKTAATKIATTPKDGKVVDAANQAKLVGLMKKYQKARTPAQRAEILDAALTINPSLPLSREQRRIREEFGF